MSILIWLISVVSDIVGVYHHTLVTPNTKIHNPVSSFFILSEQINISFVSIYQLFAKRKNAIITDACMSAGLVGSYSSHSLRKSFGYQARMS